MPGKIDSKKTKIVATIGPVSENEEIMTKMIKAGMNVARLNFSHGDFKEHGKRISTVRKISKKLNIPLAILQDLSGPKIRIGDFSEKTITLKEGQIFTLTTKKCIGDDKKVFINYKNLPKDVQNGATILLDDGKKRLTVLSTTKDSIKCRVEVGGETKGRRGVNVPGTHLKISSITAKDKKDLAFGIKREVDFVALSFVREPKDILDLRKILNQAKSDIAIIAKIETREAITHIDEIISLSDGIMVARGDLAIEVPTQDVPVLQKMIIMKCNIAGKPVITATQMLESMILSPVPTRAEVSDVANSILDGTDAVMLSEETTLGHYPIKVVEMMRDVALKVEEQSCIGKIKNRDYDEKCFKGTVDSVSGAVVRTAKEVDAKVIFALTESGFTGRMISRFRTTQPIIVMSPHERVANKVILNFGCYPVTIKGLKSLTKTLSLVKAFALKNKLVKKGERYVISAGVPFGRVGGTNLLMVDKII